MQPTDMKMPPGTTKKQVDGLSDVINCFKNGMGSKQIRDNVNKGESGCSIPGFKSVLSIQLMPYMCVSGALKPSDISADDVKYGVMSEASYAKSLGCTKLQEEALLEDVAEEMDLELCDAEFGLCEGFRGVLARDVFFPDIPLVRLTRKSDDGGWHAEAKWHGEKKWKNMKKVLKKHLKQIQSELK